VADRIAAARQNSVVSRMVGQFDDEIRIEAERLRFRAERRLRAIAPLLIFVILLAGVYFWVW
jgi:hypothetical protein